MISIYFSFATYSRKKFLLFIFIAFGITLYSQQTYIVNTVSDLEDANLNDNFCADLNGECSLRAAIQNTNLTVETDYIHFNIPGEQVHTVLLSENLPIITETVLLDATTQPGYSWEFPKVVIDGSNIELIEVFEETPRELAPSGFILMGNSSGSLIKGFVLGGFGLVKEDDNGETVEYYLGIAIHILNTGNHLIQGNYIGVKADGFTPFKNVFGITTHSLDNYPNSNNNQIGGIARGEINVIGGSWRSGILLGYKSGKNKIVGNYLGLSSFGNQSINNSYGISVTYPSYENIIHDNFVAGNRIGIHLVGGNNTVYNNVIGLNKEKSDVIPNNYGVAVKNSKNLVGLPNSGNLISGNRVGVVLYEDESIYTTTQDNSIQYNFIGTDESGLNSIPNQTGIIVSGINCFENSISNNIISGNLGNGISIEQGSNKNSFFANLVGININGTALGNGESGFRISGKDNILGGIYPEQSNSIAFNAKAAISVIDSINVINNKISSNKIFSNGFGVDLADDTFTTNDENDQDEGPNRLQNFPELFAANFTESSLDLEYMIDSDPQRSSYPLTIEIFKSDGNRQGKEFLGTFIVTEKDLPKGRFKSNLYKILNLSPGINLTDGDLILATATDSNGNTSEFSSEISVSITGNCTQETWYSDADGDGFGNALSTKDSCSQPEGYILDNTDCDDNNAQVFPGALDDTVDGIDQDCDGTDGPDSLCTGSDVLLISETCSNVSNIYWNIENPGTCETTGRWELRKSSSTGDSFGTFSLAGGESIQVVSGTVSKGKTQIVVYWNDNNGLELSTNQNASGIECSAAAQAFHSESSNELFVSPNPITEEGIGIYFTEPVNGGTLQVKIYNSSGNLIVSENQTVYTGSTSITLKTDHSSWLEGVYILNASLNGVSYQTQFIK